MPDFKLRKDVWTKGEVKTNIKLVMQRFLPGNRKGYSIIELLVVVVIMGFLAALVIPSFTSFQQNQDLKLSAEELKSDIRLAQSRSLSGSKGTSCAATDTLLGWYFSMQAGSGQNTYSIAGACRTLVNNVVAFNTESKTTKNSRVEISSIRIDGVSQPSLIFGLFAPVSGKISYYPISFASIPVIANQQVEITLTNTSISDPSNNTYRVIITRSGEVYATK